MSQGTDEGGGVYWERSKGEKKKAPARPSAPKKGCGNGQRSGLWWQHESMRETKRGRSTSKQRNKCKYDPLINIQNVARSEGGGPFVR